MKHRKRNVNRFGPRPAQRRQRLGPALLAALVALAVALGVAAALDGGTARARLACDHGIEATNGASCPFARDVAAAYRERRQQSVVQPETELRIAIGGAGAGARIVITCVPMPAGGRLCVDEARNVGVLLG